MMTATVDAIARGDLEPLDGQDLSVTLPTKKGDTPLTWAVRTKQPAAVRRLLDLGAAVDGTTSSGATALFLACQEGHAGIVRMLRDAGASARPSNELAPGITPLFRAATRGHAECVQLLCETGAAAATIDLATKSGATPLFTACREGHDACTRLLIDAGASIEQPSSTGATPLFIASKHGHAECMRLLIDADASVDQARHDGATPVLTACAKGHPQCVALLLEAGARGDLACDGKNGATALHMACRHGHTECARLICEADTAALPPIIADDVRAGARVRIHGLKGRPELNDRVGNSLAFVETKERWVVFIPPRERVLVRPANLLCEPGRAVLDAQTGSTSRDQAAGDPAEPGVSFPRTQTGLTALAVACSTATGHAEIVKLLCAAGAAPDIANLRGCTPLHLASINSGDAESVRHLLNAGASIDLPVDAGNTALSFAASSGNAEVVSVLCDAGASVDVTLRYCEEFPDGRTPLQLACSNGHAACVQRLLQAGVAIDKPCAGRGLTALHCACTEGHLDCAQLLLDAGANTEAQTPQGATALHVACDSGHADVAKAICLDRGSFGSIAAIDQTNRARETALFRASLHGHRNCVQLCLDAGADVGSARPDGGTSLILASQNGHTAVVRLLCEAGAVDIARTTEEANAALLCAAQYGHFECVRVLSSYGMTREAHAMMGFPEDMAAQLEHEELLEWLIMARDWTPLHHIEELTVERARALLRSGAELQASVLERARRVGGEVSALLLRAARWSVHSHGLFPKHARARAVSLMRLGYLLAWSRPEQQQQSLVDVWRDCVLPHAVDRDRRE